MFKYFLTAALLSFSVMTVAASSDAPKPWGAVPSAAQLHYYRQEVSSLIHYGPNTYTGPDGIEWGDSGRLTPDSMYLPPTLDTDQWIRAAKAGGIERIIMVAKHHDGFRHWRTSEYSVAQMSPERNPKGIDLMEEISRSCTKFAVDMGVYMSPWDVYEDKGRALQGLGEGKYGNGSGTPGAYPLNDDYNRMYETHLRELFFNKDKKYGRNGTFVELWLDGAKNASKQQTYDFTEWVRLTKEASGVAPDGTRTPDYECINFQGGHLQEISWPGNERGEINPNFWSKITHPGPSNPDASSRACQNPTGTRWTIWEGDFPLRPGWFWHPSQNGRAKSGTELFRRYLSSVGNGGIMLIGLAPNRDGLIGEDDIQALSHFGRLRQEVFGENHSRNLLRSGTVTVTASVPLRGGNPVYAPAQIADTGDRFYDTYWAPDDSVRTASLTVNLGGMRTFDLVRLQEYIPLGQRIDSFKVEVGSGDGWRLFAKGTAIGWQRLLSGPVVRTDRLRITLGSAYAAPVLCNIGLYKLPAEIEQRDAYVPAGLAVLNDEAFGGMPEDGRGVRRFARPEIEGRRNLVGGDVTMLSGRAYKTAIFTGSKFWLRGEKEIQRQFGADIRLTVDGKTVLTADATSASTSDLRHPFPGNSRGMILFTSPDLDEGQHTVRIESATPDDGRSVTLDALLYLPSGRACFEFSEVEAVTVDEGREVVVEVRRLGDISKPASVRVASHPGTAVHGEDFIQEAPVLTFAAGERTRAVTFRTRDNFKKEGTQYFTLRLEAVKGTLLADSFNMERRVNIRDND